MRADRRMQGVQRKSRPKAGLAIQTPVIVDQIAVDAGFDSRRRSRAARCQISMRGVLAERHGDVLPNDATRLGMA